MEDKLESLDINDQVQEEPPKKDKGYKIKENMTGADFYRWQVDSSNVFEKPFDIIRPDEVDVR